MELLVVGTGRSGTGFVSKVLTDLGLPCGHEQAFNPESIRVGVAGLTPHRAEASWMGLPFVPICKRLGIEVVHVTRDPIDVYRSLMGIEWLAEFNTAKQMYEDVAYHMFPDLPDFSVGTQSGRVLAFMEAMYDGLAHQALPTVHVEDLSVYPHLWDKFFPIPAVPGYTVMAKVREHKAYNTRPHLEDDLPAPVRTRLRAMRKALNYNL